LKSSFGRIVTASELGRIEVIVRQLRTLRIEKGTQDHRTDIHSILAGSVIPIELAHTDSLILLARTDEQYSLRLS